ncbi:MAG TPA: hypothetical protein PLE10_02200 [Brevefilum sp.]|nr:hypothetical protein [Brevefilum sp.]HPL68818.1 hypothetical protein [Brevefilum sp.]
MGYEIRHEDASDRYAESAFWRLFHPVADRLASLSASFDQVVESESLPAASARALLISVMAGGCMGLSTFRLRVRCWWFPPSLVP